ncbi:unnamed protein product [Caenorhabditis auriculariae]|uniref:Uncharacterized protein n=1 Tax=Caenorhabditis auriculariae TaxID=2777116 RepID=A0A8S1HNG8_9PELO|nr:unnamed protein product [Caenorhabditis auriculariae]
MRWNEMSRDGYREMIDFWKLVRRTTRMNLRAAHSINPPRLLSAPGNRRPAGVHLGSAGCPATERRLRTFRDFNYGARGILGVGGNDAIFHSTPITLESRLFAFRFPPQGISHLKHEIYTDWANRYLAKGDNYKPIRDISNELRDYRIVAQLINVIEPETNSCVESSCKLRSEEQTHDIVEACCGCKLIIHGVWGRRNPIRQCSELNRGIVVHGRRYWF